MKDKDIYGPGDDNYGRDPKPWEGVVKPIINMKPTVGRIVHYNCTEEEKKLLNNFQPIAPAIITAVWSDTCVNLKILTDGNFNLWKTSVNEGTAPFSWSWPVIEK